MGHLGQIMRDGRYVRILIVGVAVVSLVTTMGGVAFAVTARPTNSVAKGKNLDEATTYEIVLPAGGGSESVQWEIGRATVEATASATYDPDTGGTSWAMGGLGVTNDGSERIALPGLGAGLGESRQCLWLGPGEHWGDIAAAGEVYNTYDYVPGPGPGELIPMAILDEGGASVTGFFAWSFHFDPDTQTGHFVYTLNMKG